jgi:hypothetical protein
MYIFNSEDDCANAVKDSSLRRRRVAKEEKKINTRRRLIKLIKEHEHQLDKIQKELEKL